MEDEELEAVPVVLRKTIDGEPHGRDELLDILDLTRRQELVVDFKRNERVRQPAEVLLESRSDSVNVQIRV